MYVIICCLLLDLEIISSRELIQWIESTSIAPNLSVQVHTPLVQTQINETVYNHGEKTMSAEPQVPSNNGLATEVKSMHFKQVVKRRQESKGFDLMKRICAFLKQQILGIKIILDF